MYVYVFLVPYLPAAVVFETNPARPSGKELRSIGIQPGVSVCRTERPLSRAVKEKIALYCDVAPDAVIQAIDVSSIYEVPLILEREGLGEIVTQRLKLECGPPDLADWQDMVDRILRATGRVRVALVGKYMGVEDSYVSIVEALRHGGIAHRCEVVIAKVDSEGLEALSDAEVATRLAGFDGILVCPGFGARGVEGKGKAIRFAREPRLPCRGAAEGRQWAVTESARHVCALPGANTTEVDPATPHPVIHLLPEQQGITEKGGTMRLGRYPCRLTPGSLAGSAYGEAEGGERHRHRYEVNNAYLDVLTRHGRRVTGVYTSKNLVGIIELSLHSWVCGR